MQRSSLGPVLRHSIAALAVAVACSRPASTGDGKPPTLYRIADLRWDSKAAMDKRIATAGFKAVTADLANFATGGWTVLIGAKTN
jgi:hypothetical protein